MNARLSMLSRRFQISRNNRLATVGRSHWNVWTASITHTCTSCTVILKLDVVVSGLPQHPVSILQVTSACSIRHRQTQSSITLSQQWTRHAMTRHDTPHPSHTGLQRTANKVAAITAQATIEDLRMRRQRSKETNILCGLPEDVHLYIAMTLNTIFIKTTKISYASRQ